MYDLTALRQTTDKILEIVGSNSLKQFLEPINWANLRCLEASYVQTDDGRKYYRVVIESAAPGCSEFRAYVAERLAESGFKDVEVVTEW